jgi:hypothetical protein
MNASHETDVDGMSSVRNLEKLHLNEKSIHSHSFFDELICQSAMEPLAPAIESDIELVVDKLKLNLNRTNSNASCNSTNSLIDSGYISSNDLLDAHATSTSSVTSTPTSTSMSTYTLLNNCPTATASHQQHEHLYELVAARCLNKLLNVTAGYYGKAKTTLELTEPASTTLIALEPSSDDTRILRDNVNIVSYGDDVGLVLDKTMYEKRQADSSEATIVNQIYFGVADGVSANRSRGYDPSLFPNALLNACADFILQTEHMPDVSLDYCQENVPNTNVYIDEDEENSNNEDNNEEDEEEEDKDFYYQLNEVFNVGMFNEEINEDRLTMSTLNGGCDYEYASEQNVLISNATCVDRDGESKHLFNTLQYAHDLVQERKVYGSSTVCLMSLRMRYVDESTGVRHCLLSTCNLGDSGYMIMRNRQVVFKSQTQSHRFNAPFQIGCTPPELLDHDLYRDK